MMITQDVQRIAALSQRGDLQAVRSQGAALLAREPSNAIVLQIVGIAHCQTGDVAGGAQFLRRAVAADQRNLDARLNLARALVDLGELAEAEELLASAPGPRQPMLVRMRAEIAKQRGATGDAAALYREIVAKNPEDAESWNNLGNALRDAGDEPGAIDALRRANALVPNEPRIAINLSRALVAFGDPDGGVSILEQAIAASPDSPDAFFELGKLLASRQQHAAALPMLGSAARLDPSNPEILCQIAMTFGDVGEVARAEEGYRFALRANPRTAQAYLGLGTLFEQSNRTDELSDLIAQAEAEGVAGGEIEYLRAMLLRRQGRLEDALAAARRITTDVVDAPLKWQLIGDIADKLGDVDAAFSAFEKMNEATAEDPVVAAIDPAEQVRQIDHAASFTTPEWYASWTQVELPDQPRSPVFVVGCPRSGTTLTDTFLMGHPDAQVLEELSILLDVGRSFGDLQYLNDASADDIRGLRSRYFERLAQVAPTPPGKLVIDKQPLNFLRSALIHRIFPDARIVFVQRHPCDVVLSCFMQAFKVNQAMASFLDIGNAARLYDKALSYWTQVQDVLPLQVHTLRYESMIADLEPEMRAMVDFIGLPWDDRLLDNQATAASRGHIRTPSYAQVSQPIYARARGRWEKYREHMREVLPILAPWVERMGYEPLEL